MPTTQGQRARRTQNAARLAAAVHEATPPDGPSLWQRIRAVPRMVRAVRSGQYTGLTSGRLALMLAGMGYVLSPIDVVPEGFLLAFGLVDDLLVLGWVATTLVRETEDFIAWERGGAQRPPRPDWGPAHGETVDSHVVHD